MGIENLESRMMMGHIDQNGSQMPQLKTAEELRDEWSKALQDDPNAHLTIPGAAMRLNEKVLAKKKMGEPIDTIGLARETVLEAGNTGISLERTRISQEAYEALTPAQQRAADESKLAMDIRGNLAPLTNSKTK